MNRRNRIESNESKELIGPSFRRLLNYQYRTVQYITVLNGSKRAAKPANNVVESNESINRSFRRFSSTSRTVHTIEANARQSRQQQNSHRRNKQQRQRQISHRNKSSKSLCSNCKRIINPIMAAEFDKGLEDLLVRAASGGMCNLVA